MDLTQVSIDQLLSALEKRLENANHLANTEAITTIDVGCYKRRARALPRCFDTLQNALTPFHKLPDELLIRIFSLIQPPPRRFPFPDTGFMMDPQFEWLSVTKVCRYWRYLVLGSPSLWCTIALPRIPLRHGYKLQRWFFKNSNPMTIHLFNQNVEDFFPPDIHRLETLDLKRLDDLQEQWGVLKHPIESLTTLSLSRDDFQREFLDIPKMLGGRPSNVKNLSLTGLWRWPKNISTFRNISHLSLSAIEIRISCFLEMMNACPALEALYLFDIQAFYRAPRGFDPASSWFPRLKFLVFENCRVLTNSIFMQLFQPSPLVEVYAFGRLDSDINGFLDLLDPKLAQTITLIDLHFHTGRNAGFSLKKGSDARFSIGYKDIGMPFLDVLARPFLNTKELHFSSAQGRLGSTSWLAQIGLTGIFRYLANLSTIRFHVVTNYLPFLDAVSGSSIPLNEVFVKEITSWWDTDEYPKDDQVRLKGYQEAGVTMIQHSEGTSSYRLVVESIGRFIYQPICIPEVAL